MDELAFLPGGKEIRLRLGKLIEERRVVWLDYNGYTPVAVARVVDLSLCLGINSAGIVCAAHGFRALHWDNVGWKHYPHYSELSGKVVFSSLEEMKKAVFQVYKGESTMGDLSSWHEDYNFFNDQKGMSRITDFIDIFMDCLEQAQTRDGALTDTVSRYCQKNRIRKESWQKQ